jgi:hypothetical protein
MKAVGIIAWMVLGEILGAVLFWNFSGLPKQEGYLAMMAVFAGGPVGAVAGVIFALKMMRQLSNQGARKFVGFSLFAAVLLSIVVVAVSK